MDKVDSLIDELMDKVDECKDEMKRMRKYGKAVGDKDKELSEVNSSHKQAVAKLEATIKDLQSKLETSQESYVKLEKSKKEMMENYELLIREQDEEETEDEYDSDGEESSRTPVRRGRQQQQETGGTKQMVRSVSQSTTGTSSSGTRTNSPESSSGSEENDEELWQSCSDLDVFSVELVTSIVNDGAEVSTMNAL
jgi:TolA-binding protein